MGLIKNFGFVRLTLHFYIFTFLHGGLPRDPDSGIERAYFVARDSFLCQKYGLAESGLQCANFKFLLPNFGKFTNINPNILNTPYNRDHHRFWTTAHIAESKYIKYTM